MPIGMITYMDGSRKEDLVDIITNVSPTQTPLLSGLGSGPEAMQTLHEYLSDNFADGGDNAAAESSGFTAEDLVQPTRKNNVTQIFKDDIQVSDTHRAVDVGGMQDPFDYQINKKLVEHAKDIEHALMRGSRASGSSGSERRLEGVINGISTNASTRNSGATFSEDELNDIFELIYDSTDDVADEVYVGGKLKRTISGFSGRAAGVDYTLQADDPRIVNTADIYWSDFGRHTVFLHRDVANTQNSLEFVAINSKYWKLSWLNGRRTKVTPLAKEGDRSRAMLVSELTLENRGEEASAVFDGYHTP